MTDDRQATISRAVDLIDTADPADLDAFLAATTIREDLKRDPLALRDALTRASGDKLFSAWKAAQKLLLAAGLPY